MTDAPTPLETAVATADTVGALASHFMLDMATYARGGELGFEGLGFYFAGRAGALGDVDADVVTATFGYFHPDTVRAGWEGSAGVMPRLAAAEAFGECAHAWARTHLPQDFDAAGLAGLAGKVTASASAAGAPLFAAWRRLAEPADAPALALHRMHLLRELRGGLHLGAVLAAGLAPEDALAVRTPYMAALFGWPEAGDTSSVKADWEQAEEATNVAMARVLSVLDDTERTRFVALCAEVQTVS
jgi:hypothetical protein